MKMAKDQSLFLNPAKFSGVCGKLMCCLRYEHEYYVYAHKRMPLVGAIVNIEQGRARVKDVNVISRTLTLETEEGAEIHVPASKLHLEGTCRRHGAGCCMSDRHCEPLLANDDEDQAPELVKEDCCCSHKEEPAPIFDEPIYHPRPEPMPVPMPEVVSGVRFREPLNKPVEISDGNSGEPENSTHINKPDPNKNQQKNKPKTQPGKNPNRLHGHGKTKRKPGKKPQEKEES